mmetsp:Transcript_4444/g.8626  ORF Transcript_4444/g.8626 Transcript_4444/m.8626 type:complete len:200 (+) Transcript_4444:6-605(+)
MASSKHSSSRSHHTHTHRSTATKPPLKETTNRSSDPIEQHRIEVPTLAMVFHPNRDSATAYHTEGDPAMYVEDAMLRRRQLHDDSQLNFRINEFIRLYNLDMQGMVTKREYEKVHAKIAKVLRPNLEPDEVKELIKEDWERDCKGGDKMTTEALYDGLFELCDVWCPNIDLEEYVEFFKQLDFRVRYEGQRDKTAYDII